MPFHYTNRAKAQIARSLTARDTTITLMPGTGDLFPSPASEKDRFALTLSSVHNNDQYEICYVLSRNGDTLTLLRGQENTIPQAFESGDVASLNMTAGLFDLFPQAGYIGVFSQDVATRINGYAKNAIVCDPSEASIFWISQQDGNTTPPGESSSWVRFNASSSYASPDDLNAERIARQNADNDLEQNKVNRSGDNLTGALWSTGTFNPSQNVFATQPVGASLKGEELYLQLVNDNNTGVTYGRLVLRDGGGNFHIPIQVDNKDNTTINGNLTVTGNATYQSPVFVSGTFSPSQNVFTTQPIGVEMNGMRFYNQMVNDNNTGTTKGQLVLEDGGGNYHVLIQADNNGHITDGQGREFLSKPEAEAAYLPLSGGTLTGPLQSDDTILSTGTFKVADDVYATHPIGASMGGMQYCLQIVNDNNASLTTGKMILRDGSGKEHTPIEVDNRDNTTINGNLTVTGPVAINGGEYNGAYYGGQCKSIVPGVTANASLQLQGSDGNEIAALVLQDNAGGWHDWEFNASGVIATPSGNTLPEIVGNPGGKIQVMQMSSVGTNTWISFPQPCASSTPYVRPVGIGQYAETDWFVWGVTSKGAFINPRNTVSDAQILIIG